VHLRLPPPKSNLQDQVRLSSALTRVTYRQGNAARGGVVGDDKDALLLTTYLIGSFLCIHIIDNATCSHKGRLECRPQVDGVMVQVTRKGGRATHVRLLVLFDGTPLWVLVCA
jgi:hypothetical protein